MSVNLEDLIRNGVFDIELGVANPLSSGYDAGEGAFGKATDGSRWIKVGTQDTDWEQIFVTDNGDFVANISLSDVSNIIPPEGVLGLKNGYPSIGDSETVGGKRLALEKYSTLRTAEDALSPSLSGATFEDFDSRFTATIDGNGIGEILPISALGAEKIVIPWTPFPSKITTSSGFYGNGDPTGIHIPDSVINIGSGAFAYSSLTSVVIPNSVTLIGNAAFASNSLTSVTIPDSVTSIGSNAFSYNSLESVVIPNSVTLIASNAFSSNNLTSVTIGNSVTTIGNFVFATNGSLNDVTANVTKTVFDTGSNILNGTAEPLTLRVPAGDTTWDALESASPTSYQGNSNVTVVRI